ncbi:MAG: hypothetical protein MJ134_10865 [Lachnospiraceae bacterium]|nr:hypothetical protein [Lachnospiraceae bacterium]
MNILVSGVTGKEGERKAYVRFEDDTRYAEGTIPTCTITDSSGFTQREIKELELYMIDHLTELKKEAAVINPFRAMMKD